MWLFSRLYGSECKGNVNQQGGEADIYYPLWVRRRGSWRPALLTKSQLDVALERGRQQPEDVPPRAPSGLIERVLRRVGWR